MRTTDVRHSVREMLGIRGVILLGGVGIAFLVCALIWIESGKSAGRQALGKGRLSAARSSAMRYLWLHPRDSEALMIAAQGFALDDSLPPREAAAGAISLLQRIPDAADEAVAARLLEGRLTFLILHQPAKAEELFHRVIELNPDHSDAHYMLWKLYDMTERFFDGEPEFHKVYQLTPEVDRAFRLREWYLSQFTPLSACGQLDLMMGFRDVDEAASESVAYERLQTFVLNEPNAPTTVAALAQWHLRNREWEIALEVLEGLPDVDAACTCPMYTSTLCEVLIELGQFERAEVVFAKWPPPLDGYQYWRISGILNHEVRQDYEQAAICFEKAVAIWPGPSDWLTMHRWFRSLAILGDTEASEVVRKRAEHVERCMDQNAQWEVFKALQDLNDSQVLQTVVDFYEKIGQPWEANEWRKVISATTSVPVIVDIPSVP